MGKLCKAENNTGMPEQNPRIIAKPKACSRHSPGIAKRLPLRISLTACTTDSAIHSVQIQRVSVQRDVPGTEQRIIITKYPKNCQAVRDFRAAGMIGRLDCAPLEMDPSIHIIGAEKG